MSIIGSSLKTKPPERGNLAGRFPVDAFQARSYTGFARPGPALAGSSLLKPSRSLIALLCALVLLAAPASGLASEQMYMGAAEDEGRNADPAVAMAKMELAKAAGFDTIRVTAVWSPGQTAVPADQLQALQSIAAAGDFLGIHVVATVMNFGSRTTPLTLTSRVQFARFAADLVKRVPSIREYIVGNEPNLNRYWLPQFAPNGSDAAAIAPLALPSTHEVSKG